MEEKFIEAPPKEEPSEPPVFPQNTFSHIRNKTRRRELYRQFKLDVAKVQYPQQCSMYSLRMTMWGMFS